MCDMGINDNNKEYMKKLIYRLIVKLDELEDEIDFFNDAPNNVFSFDEHCEIVNKMKIDFENEKSAMIELHKIEINKLHETIRSLYVL